MWLKKKDLLQQIKKQIEIREELLDYIEKTTIPRIKSNPLIDLNPFTLLIADHHKLHNLAEIEWLKKFRDMVESIDFAKNISEIIERRKKMEKQKEINIQMNNNDIL